MFYRETLFSVNHKNEYTLSKQLGGGGTTIKPTWHWMGKGSWEVSHMGSTEEQHRLTASSGTHQHGKQLRRVVTARVKFYEQH